MHAIVRPMNTAAQTTIRGESGQAQPSPILRRWQALEGKPFRSWLFLQGIKRMVPYTGTIRPLVRELRPGFAKIEMTDRRIVRNHLQSIHAVALVNLGEVASGLAMMAGLDNSMRGIVTHLEIDYLKKARGTLTATCSCEPPVTQAEQRYEVVAEIRDEEGDEVARATVHWKLGPKR